MMCWIERGSIYFYNVLFGVSVSTISENKVDCCSPSSTLPAQVTLHLQISSLHEHRIYNITHESITGAGKYTLVIINSSPQFHHKIMINLHRDREQNCMQHTSLSPLNPSEAANAEQLAGTSSQEDFCKDY